MTEPSKLSLRGSLRLAKAAVSIRDTAPDKVSGRVLQRLEVIEQSRVKPGPSTRERIQGTGLWKRSDLRVPPPADVPEVLPEGVSPNPLLERGAGFVQRKSPLTRRLDALKLTASSPAKRKSGRSPPAKSARGKGGGGGYLQSGRPEPAITKPSATSVPFTSVVSEIRRSPRIATVAAAATAAIPPWGASKASRWSAALATAQAHRAVIESAVAVPTAVTVAAVPPQTDALDELLIGAGHQSYMRQRSQQQQQQQQQQTQQTSAAQNAAAVPYWAACYAAGGAQSSSSGGSGAAVRRSAKKPTSPAPFKQAFARLGPSRLSRARSCRSSSSLAVVPGAGGWDGL